MEETPVDPKVRRSNRRTILALGVVVLIFAAPLLYVLGRYLLFG